MAENIPERIWIQRFPNAIAAYERDPREVHDNGKPVYVYIRTDLAAPDAAQQINEAVKDIMDHFLTVEIDELPSSSQIRSILRKRLLTSPDDLARVRRETGWLLEKMDAGSVRYITADYVLTWTDDPNKALRLARREDAEMLTTIIEDCEKVTEHEWDDGAAALRESEEGMEKDGSDIR